MFKRFMKDESGATAIEYALIAALVGIVIITGLNSVSGAINETLESVGETMTSAG